ncbi:hypothetical protein FF124_07420 [Martelella lutilitoris]|uniref:DUF8173 domain-containing protein n=2 Tax=Martelella lutilitoris TaxID=2583532 RepID=A0A5C4JSL9_9HYPH|nr:hypothetical protein FF124_07420 [Martelella lutilitoris]
MMDRTIRLAAAAVLALLPATALADDDLMVFGGDTYVSGQTANLDTDSGRSAFVSGFSASIDAAVTKDAHIAGGHVSVDAPVSGDLYAAGFWIAIDGPVGGDLSASGYSVSLEKNATIGGNSRIAARTIEIDADLAGSLLAVAQDITINTEITGDVMLAVDNLTFGPNAKIDGLLSYVGPQDIEIPESVISADRVTHRRIAGAALSSLAQMTAAGEALHDLRENGAVRTAAEIAAGKEVVKVAGEKTFGHDDDNVWALLAGFLVTLIAYVIVAAIFFNFAPARTETIRVRLMAKPFASLCYGFLALSMLVGAVPVAAITIVGIVLIPFVILLIVAACILSYLVAAYAFAWGILSKIKPISPSLTNKLLATAAGIVLLSLTHYLWFFGWIINLAVVLIGLGAIAAVCGKGMMARREESGNVPVSPAAVEDKPADGSPASDASFDPKI